MKKIDINQNVMNLVKDFDSFVKSQNYSGIESKIEESIELNKKDMNDISKIQLNYSIGTAYGDLLEINKKCVIDSFDKDINSQKQLFYLRKAELLARNSKEVIPKELLLQIYTNLGNAYCAVSRNNEAIEVYNSALDINQEFGMALGNMAVCLIEYADALNDEEQRLLFHHKANELFEECLKDNTNVFEEAKNVFEYYHNILLNFYDSKFLKQKIAYTKNNIYDFTEEVYRKWCSENKLFLNPVNDIVNNDSVMHDCLHLPSMIISMSEGINYKFHGLINEIKQEYISSRYMFFDAIQLQSEEHFSDKYTYILDTLDYASYSLNNWKIRMVFRSLYSILDKVSFFLNEYYDIGIRERDINYKTIWYSEMKSKNYKYKKPLIDKLADNSALYAIYWICKDFIEGEENSVNPRIAKISQIRNSLEHKYLKIVDNPFGNMEELSLTDKLAYYISKEEIQDICMFLLKEIRSLIINLISAVNITERKKAKENEGKVIPKMNPLMEIEDEWKI